jgi:alpha-beta hydrolase superfamily lysophospholipase
MKRALSYVLLAFALVGGIAVFGVERLEYSRGESTRDPVMQDDAFVMSDGARLPYRAWGRRVDSAPSVTPRGVMLALHGAGAHAGFLSPLGEYFSGSGIVTYAYDQRGHGAGPNRGCVPGAGTLVADVIEVVALLRAKYENVPLYIVGASMGGSVLLSAAEANRLPAVEGVILLAPGVDGWQAVPRRWRPLLRIGSRIAPNKLVKRPPAPPGYSDNPVFVDSLGADPLIVWDMSLRSLYNVLALTEDAYRGAEQLAVPTLLAYGSKDIVVSEARVMDVGRRITGPARMIVYMDGYHDLIWDEQRDNVLRDIDAWIRDREAEIPSVIAARPAAEEVNLGAPPRL